MTRSPTKLVDYFKEVTENKIGLILVQKKKNVKPL